MARFDFQSPGAAFTGQIAEALAQRKAEERQMMLDQLTVNADSRAQENALRQAAEHKQQLAAGEQAMRFGAEDQDFQRAGMIAQGLDAGGEIPTESLPLFQRLGWAKQLPTPQVSTETSVQMPEGADPEAFAKQLEQTQAPAGPAKFGYVGNLEQRDKQRARESSSGLIARLMESPKTKQQGEFLSQLMAVNDGVIPEAVASKFLQPDVPLHIFDVDSGRVTNAGNISPHAQVVTRSRPPRDIRTQWVHGGEKDGNTVFFDAENPARQVSIDASRRGGGSSSSNQASLGSLNIPSSYLDDINLSMSALVRDPRGVTPEALGGFRNAMSIGFNEAKVNVSPAARQAASSLLNTELQQGRQLLEQLVATGQLTIEDANDAMTLYSSVPQPVRDVLAKNPYDPNKKKESWWPF
jgi:hypothetical protein